MASSRSRAAASSKNEPAANVQAGPVEFKLADVIAASQTPEGFLYTPRSFHEPLIESGDVLVNRDMIEDGTGNIATRATDKHLAQPKETTMTEDVKTAPTFVIENDIPVPARTRAPNSGAGRTAIYPFDSLEIGQSFFVANKQGKNEKGEDFPTAFKSMSSTVASRNAFYREEIPGTTRTINKGKGVGKTALAYKQLRQFKLYDTERKLADGTVEKGARVYRVKVEKEIVQ